ARLREAGHAVSVVLPAERFDVLGTNLYGVDPGSREDHDTLLRMLKEARSVPRTIVHAWSVSQPDDDPDDPAAVEREQRLGFLSRLSAVQALVRLDASARFRFVAVSNEMHRVTGAEKLRPGKALLLGLCRVAPKEMPQATFQTVDVVLAGRNRRAEAELLR